MKKIMLAVALAAAVPAAAQFPSVKGLTKAAESTAKKEGDKAQKDATKTADKAAKDAEKDAKKEVTAALKADLVDSLALPRGDAKAPVTFAKLSAALAAAELDKALKGPGPFTLFAPTDAAFAKIPEADLTALLADKVKLQAVLKAHVVDGIVKSKDIKPGKVKTHGGAEITVMQHGAMLMVGPGHVVTADIEATNGVIHIVDTVIMPK